MSYNDKRSSMVGWDPADSYKDSWSYTQNVVSASGAYGPDRSTQGLPNWPSDGVRVRVGNPSQEQIAVAASSVGMHATDKVITVWTDTLRAVPADGGSERIYILEGDRLVVGGVRYFVKFFKETEFGTQLVCYCGRDPDQNFEPGGS